ncbi:MAG: ATP-binding cassette domain-containing protein [Clostridiales bacterium]|nr:ATP-binding cassette domain-containing protein [Clostridiales bacterium]
MIEVNGLTRLYKNNRGIKNLSFKLEDGDILGLLGPNGSGKTTAMKAMLALIRTDCGTVKVDGKDIHEDFEEIMASTGALIEAPAIYKDLSAYRNMYLAAKSPDERAEIDRMLDLVHLLPYKHEKAGKFSLGMKQRLGLAEALMGKPRLVILDEPVNGLDIEGVVEIRELIKDMNKKFGTTFIISSHIASEIEKLCTKTAVISESELIAMEDTEKIMSLYPSMEDYFIEKIRERRARV